MMKRTTRLKKGKTYEALFLSDIHYLLNKKVKNHCHQELIGLLYMLRKRGIRFRRLYLVGDVIENWYFDAERRMAKDHKQKRRFAKLFDRLDKLLAEEPESGHRPTDGATATKDENRPRKIFIVGNHDTTSFTMALPHRLAGYLAEHKWEVREHYADETLTILHGHQGQYNKFNWALSIGFLRLLHFFTHFVPGLFTYMEEFYDRHLNREDPITPAEKLQFYGRLSRLVDQGNRVLICGHTHDCLCIPELRVINTGDWVKNKTFVIQTKRKLTGLRLKKLTNKAEFEVEFQLRLDA